MSGESYNVDTEGEYEQKAQELITEAKESKQELEAKQNEALQEIAEGESLERYETVSLGNLDMECKAWLPGYVEDTVTRAQELAESQNPSAIRESKRTMLKALAEMTTSDDYNKAFWREYASRYGQEGLIVAVETVLGPAEEHLEDKQDALDGFRSGTEGPRPSVGDGSNG